MNWYRYLTGSCYSGSKEFLTRNNLKDDDLGTVELFISMTENEYNGDIIKRLKPFYCKNEGV